MRAEDCPRLDNCHKIKMVMDKDLGSDELCAVLMRRVCESCNEGASRSEQTLKEVKTGR